MPSRQFLKSVDSYDLYSTQLEQTPVYVLYDRHTDSDYITLDSLAVFLGYPDIEAMLANQAVQQQVDSFIQLFGRSPILICQQPPYHSMNLVFLFFKVWDNLKATTHKQQVNLEKTDKPVLFTNVQPGESTAIWQKSTWSANDQETLFWDALVWNVQQQDWIAEVETLARIAFDTRSSEQWSARLRNTLEWCRHHGKTQFWLKHDTPIRGEVVRQSLQRYNEPYVVQPNL